MKNFNSFFNQLTAMPKRLAMVLTVLFTLGVGSMWGQATLPVDYSFSNGKSSLPTGVTQSGLGSDYAESNAPYRLKFDNTNDYIQIQTNAAAQQIVFAVKMLGGKNTSYFQLQGSSNGSSFTDIQKFTISGAQDAVVNCTTTVTIDASYRYFKFVFTKGSNVGFGTLKITKATVATPSLTATPTSLAFGTVEKGSSVAAKTFSISGSNLTSGMLSITAPTGYTVSPTSKSVNGTLSATTITVTPNTSTAGTFNSNITISGGGLTSNVTVALTMTVKEKYTVTWSVDGSTTTERVFKDAKPTTPPTISTLPCGEVFVGWTDAENGNYTHGTSKLYKTVGEIPAITGDKTFYAVFADYAD